MWDRGEVTVPARGFLASLPCELFSQSRIAILNHRVVLKPETICTIAIVRLGVLVLLSLHKDGGGRANTAALLGGEPVTSESRLPSVMVCGNCGISDIPKGMPDPLLLHSPAEPWDKMHLVSCRSLELRISFQDLNSTVHVPDCWPEFNILSRDFIEKL